MRLWERFFPKKKIAARVGVVSASELDGIIEKWMGAEKERCVGPAMAAAKEILAARDEALEIVEELESREFPDEIMNRIYKPALTHRPTYAKGMREALSTMFMPGSVYGELRAFQERVLASLRAVEKVQLSQGRYIVEVFREELFRLGGVLNRIIDLERDMEGLFQSCEGKLARYGELKARGASLRGALDRFHDIEERRRALGEEGRNIENRLLGLKAEMRSLEESEEYRDYLASTARWGENQKALEVLKLRALNILGSKIRILRKYSKFIGDRGKKNEHLLVYLEDPLSAFFSEAPGYPALRGIIADAKRETDRGALDLDAKEEAKLSLEEELEGIHREYAERSKMMRPDSGVWREMESAKAEATRLEGVLDRRRGESKTLEEERSALEASAEQLRSELEKRLSEIAGGEIRIDIPRAPRSQS